MTWQVTTDVFGKFDEALAFFRDRTPMPAEEFYQLEAEARLKAFTVSNVAQMDMVQQVLASIDKAIEEGTDLRAWKKEIGPALMSAWGSSVRNPGHRLDTIFRNNIQTAFNHGRYRQTASPAVQRLRPFGMLDAVRDKRTTDLCRKLHGTLMPLDDPKWNGLIPPLHHGCRLQRRTLRKSQALRRGGVKYPPAGLNSQEGFGAAPEPGTQVKQQPEIDPSKYDPALLAAARRKRPRPRPEARPKKQTKSQAAQAKRVQQALGEDIKDLHAESTSKRPRTKKLTKLADSGVKNEAELAKTLELPRSSKTLAEQLEEAQLEYEATKKLAEGTKKWTKLSQNSAKVHRLSREYEEEKAKAKAQVFTEAKEAAKRQKPRSFTEFREFDAARIKQLPRVLSKENAERLKRDLGLTIPTEVVELHPRAAAILGRRLEVVGDVITPEMHHTLDDFEEISLNAQRKLAGQTYLRIGSGSLTDAGMKPHLKGVRPRGWPEGKTWDHVDGAASGAQAFAAPNNPNEHGVFPNRRRIRYVVQHEYGHVFGTVTGTENAREFLEHHERLFPKLGTYQKQGGPGGFAGRQELLADAFHQYHTLRDTEFVRKYDQEFYDWLKKAIDG